MSAVITPTRIPRTHRLVDLVQRLVGRLHTHGTESSGQLSRRFHLWRLRSRIKTAEEVIAQHKLEIAHWPRQLKADEAHLAVLRVELALLESA